MSEELIKRLREKLADSLLAGLPYNRDGVEAADRIAELEAENKRLREGFNAILDRGPEREPKWAGMTAKDIAIYCLKGPDHD